MTDSEERTCKGYGPAPTSWEDAVARDLADLWPGGRDEFEEWLGDD